MNYKELLKLLSTFHERTFIPSPGEDDYNNRIYQRTCHNKYYTTSYINNTSKILIPSSNVMTLCSILVITYFQISCASDGILTILTLNKAHGAHE